MDEERILEQRFGNQTPFRVPEGYFSDFEKKLLNDIPVSASENKPMLRRLKPWIWAVISAAAVLCGVIFYLWRTDSSDSRYARNAKRTNAETHYSSDTYIDQVSDYAMLDNSDLYSYVTGE